MDDSPTQPEGFILTKQKAAEQATEHFQIVKPLTFKTGVWKFINFFIRHKHHKQKGNSGFLDQQQLREDYGLCLLSEELGGQSNPFDRELLMENDKVEGEATPGEDAKVRSDPRKFFHKMSLEGLMKLFADLHRKKRARDLAKSSPSMSEEMTTAIAFDQPCCLERVERYMRVSPSVSLKKETTVSRASSATVLETSYVRSANIATPANSPQTIIFQQSELEEEDSDGTLNLLESVRTRLTDYLNAEESVNSLRATYNDSSHDHDLIEDDWSRKIGTTMDNDSLKCDTSCDDIPSLKNNSHHTLDEVHDEISKESVCSKQSLKQDENLELNQSFLEEAINTEIIPPLMPNAVESDPQLDDLLTKSIEEASTSKSYSYRDENLGENRLIQYQLLHVMPFTDQVKNPLKYDPSQDNNLPKMLSCQDLNVAPNLDECSLVEINPSGSKDNAEQVLSDSTIVNTIEKCDRGVDALDENVQLCTTGVGSREVLHEDPTEPKPNLNLDVFGEDLIILEDVTPLLEANKDKNFEVVAVQRGSQDIMDEEEPYLIDDNADSFTEDDFNRISREEDLVFATENDGDTKKTKLLFVCKYVDDVVDDNEAKMNEEKSQVSVETASQTKEVIILEKDQNDKSELEAMIRDEIVSNLQFALDNKHLTMVTAEDQIRTSQEILDVIESNPMVNQVKHTPTEESFMNNIHLSDSITSDLLSNLDLIVLARKDDIGNTGSDSGIYVNKNDSGITTLTYRESQTLGQPVKTESVQEAEVRNNENDEVNQDKVTSEEEMELLVKEQKSIDQKDTIEVLEENKVTPEEELKILIEENPQEQKNNVPIDTVKMQVDVEIKNEEENSIHNEIKDTKVTPEELEILDTENAQQNNSPIDTVTAQENDEDCDEISNEEESSIHHEIKDTKITPKELKILAKETSQEQKNNVPIVKAQENDEDCDEIRNEEERSVHNEAKDNKVTPEELEILDAENDQEQQNNVPIDTLKVQEDDEDCDEIKNEEESSIHNEAKDTKVTPEELEILVTENAQEQQNNVPIDTVKIQEDDEDCDEERNGEESGIHKEIKDIKVIPEELEIFVTENAQEQQNNVPIDTVKAQEDDEDCDEERNGEEGGIHNEIKDTKVTPEELEILVTENAQEQQNNVPIDTVRAQEDDEDCDEERNDEKILEESSIHNEAKDTKVTREQLEILDTENAREQQNNVPIVAVKAQEDDENCDEERNGEESGIHNEIRDTKVTPEELEILVTENAQEQQNNVPISTVKAQEDDEDCDEERNEEENLEERSIHSEAKDTKVTPEELEILVTENAQEQQNNVPIGTVKAQEDDEDCDEERNEEKSLEESSIHNEVKDTKVTPEELEILVTETAQEPQNNVPIDTVKAQEDDEDCDEIRNEEESLKITPKELKILANENSQEQQNNVPIDIVKAQEDDEDCDEKRNEEESSTHSEAKDTKVTPEELEILITENAQEQKNNGPIDMVKAQEDEEKCDERRNEEESSNYDEVKGGKIRNEVETVEESNELKKENSQEQESNVSIDTVKAQKEEEECAEIRNEEKSVEESNVTSGQLEMLVKENSHERQNNVQIDTVEVERDGEEYVEIRNEEENSIDDEVKDRKVTPEEEIETMNKENSQERVQINKLDSIKVQEDSEECVEIKNEDESVTPEELEIVLKDNSRERISGIYAVKLQEVEEDCVQIRNEEESVEENGIHDIVNEDSVAPREEMEISNESSQEFVQNDDQIDTVTPKERIDIVIKEMSQERIEMQQSNAPTDTIRVQEDEKESLEISNEEESVEGSSIHEQSSISDTPEEQIEVFPEEMSQELQIQQNKVQIYTIEAQENNVDVQRKPQVSYEDEIEILLKENTQKFAQIDTVDVQGKSGDQIEDEDQSTKNGSVDSETIEVEQSTEKLVSGDTIEGAKPLASEKPEVAYAQAEEDIKTMIKELLYETEDLKETIIASATQSQHSSVDVCRGVLEDMINNISKEKLLVDAELGKAEDKEPSDTFREVAIILEAIVDKVCRAIDTKAHKNVISVNYCLVNNHFHDKSAKKLESKVVRANKNFRTFYKIKGNYCCGQTGPRVTVINLSPTSQRFLRNEEKLTNRIRRSAALLMALYEEMRDYSYYSCTSNILCDLYESMSRNERYLDLQRNPKDLEPKPDNFVADINGNIFIKNDTTTQNGLMVDPGNKEEISDNPETIDTIGQAPNTSSNNGESYSTVASSSYSKYLAMSASNSSIYSDSDEDMPSSEILPNLKYTYYSQEEINTDEEMKQIENNIEINTGRDLGLNVPLTDSASTDSVRAEVAINDSENFVKTEDDLQMT